MSFLDKAKKKVEEEAKKAAEAAKKAGEKVKQAGEKGVEETKKATRKAKEKNRLIYQLLICHIRQILFLSISASRYSEPIGAH